MLHKRYQSKILVTDKTPIKVILTCYKYISIILSLYYLKSSQTFFYFCKAVKREDHSCEEERNLKPFTSTSN